MFIEYFTYLVTFIATTGLAVIGILVSYQCFQNLKKPVLQLLLYQQIFLFSFFIYGIWGNLAIREIITDIELSTELLSKLSFFVPLIGTPFLIVSWFMLISFGFSLNGYTLSRVFAFSYFPSFFVVLLAVTFFIQAGIISVHPSPDLAVARSIAGVNLLIHFFLIFPFLKPKKSIPIEFTERSIKNTFLFYLAGVVGYSAFLSFFNILGFISTNLAFLLIFGVSTIIPLRFRMIARQQNPQNINMDYQTFCSHYEISKRESEIIWEICTGKTNKAIAEKLFITLQTVKDHTHRIYTKTEVKSRVQLANLVREKTGLKEF